MGLTGREHRGKVGVEVGMPKGKTYTQTTIHPEDLPSMLGKLVRLTWGGPFAEWTLLDYSGNWANVASKYGRRVHVHVEELCHVWDEEDVSVPEIDGEFLRKLGDPNA
jgi:hypothetical protein